MRAFSSFLVVAAPLALVGCELIAAVDHDLIATGGAGGAGATPSTGGGGTDPQGGGGASVGGGGNGGTGGSGGGECTVATRCPNPPECQTVECNNDACEPGADIAESTVCEISVGVPGVCFEGAAANGDGSCVECVDNTQCVSPSTCDTATHACVAPGCMNGVKDNDETDIDCGDTTPGAPSCNDCANGDDCVLGTDCESGFCSALVCAVCTLNSQCAAAEWCDTTVNGGTCVPDKADGQACSTGADAECQNGQCEVTGAGTSMCCNVDCGGTCRSCAMADTGSANGTCADITPGSDPKDNCATAAGDCNSGNCAAGAVCGFKASGANCNDALFCNGTDTCNAAGGCVTHTGDPCLPLDTTNNDCSESCNEATDDCTANDPAATACSDGTFCNGTESCTGGTCGGSTGNPCVGNNTGPSCDDSCNETADDCTAADALGTVCNEGAAGACDGGLVEPNCD